jgi:hypothetical protein
MDNKKKISLIARYAGLLMLGLSFAVSLVFMLLEQLFGLPYWCCLGMLVPMLIGAALLAVSWLVTKL